MSSAPCAQPEAHQAPQQRGRRGLFVMMLVTCAAALTFHRAGRAQDRQLTP